MILTYDQSEVSTTNDSVSKELCARTIGEQVMLYLEDLIQDSLAGLAEREAVAVPGKIKDILDDETLDDNNCALRIDAIVSARYQAGLFTDRHWEWE